MTIVLDSSMTAEEIQAKVRESSKRQKAMQAKKIKNNLTSLREIKASSMKNPLKLDKTPLKIQRESRDE